MRGGTCGGQFGNTGKRIFTVRRTQRTPRWRPARRSAGRPPRGRARARVPHNPGPNPGEATSGFPTPVPSRRGALVLLQKATMRICKGGQGAPSTRTPLKAKTPRKGVRNPFRFGLRGENGDDEPIAASCRRFVRFWLPEAVLSREAKRAMRQDPPKSAGPPGWAALFS